MSDQNASGHDSSRVESSAGSVSGVYADVENLGADGQQVLKSLLEAWPSSAPPPKLLRLYVRAEIAELVCKIAEKVRHETAIATGERAVAIAGDQFDSVIVIGDNNKVC